MYDQTLGIKFLSLRNLPWKVAVALGDFWVQRAYEGYDYGRWLIFMIEVLKENIT